MSKTLIPIELYRREGNYYSGRDDHARDLLYDILGPSGLIIEAGEKYRSAKRFLNSLGYKPVIIPRPKKWFGCGYGNGARLSYRECGDYTNAQGIVWKVYTPTGLSLSAWCRLEAVGHKAKMVYDPGHGFRSSLKVN